MRILVVNTLYPPRILGGAERSVALLAEGLHRAGHEPWVLTLTEGPREERGEVHGVPVIRIPTPNLYFPYLPSPPAAPRRLLWHLLDSWNPRVPGRVRAILREVRPEVVHTNLLVGFSVAVWQAARAEGLPIVHTLRDYYLLCPRSTMFKNNRNCPSICPTCRPFALPRRRASALVDTVVGISRFILQRHLRFGYFPRARTRVIPNAVARPQSAPPVSPDPEGFRIGFLGRLVPAKGLHLLLEAFHRLPHRHAELWIAGQGPADYEASLKKRYGHDPRIRWLGFVPVERVLSRVSVLVVPSLWHEPLGRVVIEAYTWGVPVVASRRGGLPEIVQEGRTGFLFDPDEPEGLHRILRQLADHPEQLAPLRKQARAYAREFSVDRMVHRYLEVYREALQGTSGENEP